MKIFRRRQLSRLPLVLVVKLRSVKEEERLNMLGELRGLEQDSGLEFYLMSQLATQMVKLQASKFLRHQDQSSVFLSDRWK